MRKAILYSMTAATMIAPVSSCLDGREFSGDAATICDDDARENVTVSFSLPSIASVSVRSSLLEGAEAVFSGATVYAYLVDGDDTRIDGIVPVAAGPEASSLKVTLPLRRNGVYDIYVTGNCWYVDKNTGAKADWSEAMGLAMPLDYASGLGAAIFRFDGAPFRGSFRHETMAEVKKYGIPYSGCLKGVRVAEKESSLPAVTCRHLFAKVNLTIDHSGLEGSMGEECFRNSKVVVRQANAALSLFSDSNRMRSVADAADAGGDCPMSGGRKETVTFYVPENMQGNLLASDNPSDKNLANPALAGKKGLVTYIEFTGTVNPSDVSNPAIGYSGTFTYRFCLGADNCRNFDVVGGHCYDVALGFTVNSLFNPEAEWKVSPDSFLDCRVIDVMKDAAFTAPIGESCVALRRNRANTVYLYVGKDGGVSGPNAILGKPLADNPQSYRAADLADCAVCVSPVGGVSLEEYGIGTLYDKSTGAFTFEVNDAAKFASFRAGSGQVEIKAVLLPSVAGTKAKTFTLKAYDDIEMILPEGDNYIGQKKRVAVKGFCGTPMLSCSVGTVFRTTNAAGSDCFLSPVPVKMTGGSIDLYAYNYNEGRSFNLTVESDDSFNDGRISKSVRVKKPRLKLGVNQVNLAIDGTAQNLDVEYFPETGSTPFADGFFDSAVYAQVLSPVCALQEGNKSQYLGSDGRGIFFKDLPPTRTFTRTLFGKVSVHGADASLFPAPVLGYSAVSVYYRYPSVISTFQDILGCNLYNIDNETDAADRKIEAVAVFDIAGCRDPFSTPRTIPGKSDWYSVDIGADCVSLTIGGNASGDGNLHLYTTVPAGSSTATAHWYVKPCVNDGSINSPWGKRTVTGRFRNVHSGNVYDIALGTFEIKYNTIKLVRFCLYPVGDSQRRYTDADCYLCTALAATLCKNEKREPANLENFTSLPIGGTRYTDYSYHSPETVTEGQHTKICLRYAAWSLRSWPGAMWNGNYPMDSGFSGVYWEEDFTWEAIRTQAGIISGCHFICGGVRTQSLGAECYPMPTKVQREQMQRYVPISISSDPEIKALTY